LLTLALLTTASAAQASCGDGRWESLTEECDDANLVPGDGCDASCVIESGFTCANAPNLNTGSTPTGVRADLGTNDLVWTWSTSLDGVSTPATVAGNCALGAWVSDPSYGRWINRHGCAQSTPEDTVTYYTASFDLASARVASQTVLSGTFWADNSVQNVYVNGAATGISFGPRGFEGVGVSFGDWPSSLYRAGKNTITVAVYNDFGLLTNPDGLLVTIPNAFGVGSTCSETCGDNVKETWEECDDGNNADNDGCSATCVDEGVDHDGDGFTKTGGDCDDSDSEINPNATEICDNLVDENCDGNLNDGCPLPPVCGDGRWDADTEQCDDGNNADADGCSAACEIEQGYTCANAPNLNTGSTWDGTPAVVGSHDPIWSWSETLSGPRTPATVADNCAPGAWVNAPTHGHWVNRYGCGQTTPEDTVTYYTAVFPLASSQAASQTVLSGTLWADNTVRDVYVNGIPTGQNLGSAGFNGPGVSFGNWPSSLYHAGVNTLTVAVYNDFGTNFNPDGLLVNLPNAFGLGSECTVQCGDGQKETWEECDDGNTTANDGCSPSCKIEVIDADTDGYPQDVDCDDNSASVHPGAAEIPYDDIDQDCDGADLCDVDGDGYLAVDGSCGGDDCMDSVYVINPGVAEVPYDGIDQDCSGADLCDVDGDGYDSMSGLCGGTDCNDDVYEVHPNADEIPYDGIDQDCNNVDQCDVDGDGYPSEQGTCGGTDCDDQLDSAYPGAVDDTVDGLDQNCDGVDGIPPCYTDADEDGYLAIECGGQDCDESDPLAYPGAAEIPYDGIDQDCDTFDLCDVDGDGHNATEGACGGDDCNDDDATVHPGATDIPGDGVDQDCVGGDEPADCTTDADADGYLAPSCGGDDCNDDDAGVNPGAAEIADDGVDQDCNGADRTQWVQGGCNTSGQSGWGSLGFAVLAMLGLRRKEVAR